MSVRMMDCEFLNVFIYLYVGELLCVFQTAKFVGFIPVLVEWRYLNWQMPHALLKFRISFIIYQKALVRSCFYANIESLMDVLWCVVVLLVCVTQCLWRASQWRSVFRIMSPQSPPLLHWLMLLSATSVPRSESRRLWQRCKTENPWVQI